MRRPLRGDNVDIIIDIKHGEDLLANFDVEKLAVFALEYEEVPENTEVSITFVDNEEMTVLNGEYRGKEGPTDVLSFECDGLDDEFMVFDDDEFEEPSIPLGDIVIAPDVCARQCGDYGTTFEQELSLLLVHGLLHLCGYDHIEEEDAVEMEALEKEILSAWYGHEVSFR